MQIIPFRFTNKFNDKIRQLFFVPDFNLTTESIKQQFLAGVAEHVAGDTYRVQIRDFPALVVMADATLISVWYDSVEA